MLIFQVTVPGFQSWLQLLTLASGQCRPWKALVMAYVNGILAPNFGPNPALVTAGIWGSESQMGAILLTLCLFLPPK